MNKVSDFCDYLLIALGTTYSLENIETILGIIILSIQVVWLLSKLVYKVICLCKKKATIDEVGEEVENTVECLSEIKDKLSKGGEVNGNSEQEE